MICPRCSSRSILKSHGTLSCLPCGHVVEEPDREAWDTVVSHAGGDKGLGPAWTESELALWKLEAPSRQAISANDHA